MTQPKIAVYVPVGPKDELLKYLADVEAQAVQEAVDEAQAKAIGSPEELVVRDLLPEDVNITGTNGEWKFDITGAGETTVIDYEVPDRKVIVLHGFKVLDQGTVKLIRIYKFNRLLDVVEVDKMEPETGYLPLRRMYVFGPKEKLRIEFVCTGASTPKILPLAKIVEKVGELIHE